MESVLVVSWSVAVVTPRLVLGCCLLRLPTHNNNIWYIVQFVDDLSL